MEGATAGAAMTMATLLSTASIGWVGTVAETVASNPLLLVGVVLGFIGVGITLFSRLLRV